MTREALTESTQLAIDETIAKYREEIMAGRSGNAVDYAESIRHLAEALSELDE